jgi:hypothetical protein
MKVRLRPSTLDAGLNSYPPYFFRWLCFIVSLFRTEGGVATMMASLIDVIGETLLSLFSARDSYDVAERFVIQIRS